MLVFNGQTADEAWKKAALCLLSESGPIKPSRGGPTHEILHACFTIADPRERWVLSRRPAINPAFAIAEVVWILTGRSDARFLTFYNSRLSKYMGKESAYPRAYGLRLRSHFQIDQLEQAYSALKANPDTRQVVLQIWDPRMDLPNNDGSSQACDIPCNVVSFLKIRGGKLEWMQVMRSNDIYRGTPYNFVQFTCLQEIMAGWLGVDLGSYNHVSDSLHVYTKDEKQLDTLERLNIRPNTDTLCLPKAKSEDVLKSLAGYVECLIEPSASQEEFSSLLSNSGLPEAYHNLLCILTSEACRRRHWYRLASDAASRCSNPVLKQLLDQWVSRISRRTVSG